MYWANTVVSVSAFNLSNLGLVCPPDLDDVSPLLTLGLTLTQMPGWDDLPQVLIEMIWKARTSIQQRIRRIKIIAAELGMNRWRLEMSKRREWQDPMWAPYLALKHGPGF